MKYKIIATNEQLKAIGISYEISGLIGKFVKLYPHNWITLKVKHKIGLFNFENEFDLPFNFIKKI